MWMSIARKFKTKWKEATTDIYDSYELSKQSIDI